MKAGSQIAKCIHENKIEAFKIRAGFIDLPLKTKDWLSAVDLKKDARNLGKWIQKPPLPTFN